MWLVIRSIARNWLKLFLLFCSIKSLLFLFLPSFTGSTNGVVAHLVVNCLVSTGYFLKLECSVWLRSSCFIMHTGKLLVVFFWKLLYVTQLSFWSVGSKNKTILSLYWNDCILLDYSKWQHCNVNIKFTIWQYN